MRHIKYDIKSKQKGVALYLTMVVLSIMSASLLALAATLVSQSKMTGNLSNSVLAFSAADSGIEQALYKVYKQGFVSGSFSSSSPNGAIYDVTVIAQASSTVIRSTGAYRQSKRAIE
ncbi:hypothetical protein COU03_02145, partial [bacterium (Candidatus Gribaldobacteria) CG10_big_fil_rev_8_21_14_0_10_41_12]